MKNSKLVKIFLVMVVCLALLLSTTSTYAVDFIEINDNGSSNTNTDANNNANTSDNNTSNTNTDSNANNNTSNSISNANTSNNTTNNTNTSNSSLYNTNVNKTNTNTNTNLPKTGIAETGSIVFIVFGLALSAVFAFKKIREYNV